MQQNVNERPQLLLQLSGRIVEGEIVDDGSHHVKLALKLSLSIKNVGAEPALLLNREPVIIEDKIIAATSDIEQDKYLFLLQTLPSIGRDSEWEQLQIRLNKPSPPPEEIRVLAPDETWTLETTNWFYIGKTENLDPNSKSWRDIQQASPVWLQVTFQVWSGDIETNVERDQLKFSKTLQRRWQRFGALQLGSLASELMPLDFSSLTVTSARR